MAVEMDQFDFKKGTSLALLNQRLLQGESINSLSIELNMHKEAVRSHINSLRKRGFVVRKGETTIYQQSDDAIYTLEER